MAMAALRNAARRLASQRPPAIHRAAATEVPRRLFHGGSSAVGRTFSLAEEQRRLLPRLMHGGSPAVGRTYSRQFHSFHRGPNTFMEKTKQGYEVLDRVSIIAVKLAVLGVVVFDLSGPRIIPMVTRVLLGLEPLEEQVPTGGKETDAESS